MIPTPTIIYHLCQPPMFSNVTATLPSISSFNPSAFLSHTPLLLHLPVHFKLASLSILYYQTYLPIFFSSTYSCIPSLHFSSTKCSNVPLPCPPDTSSLHHPWILTNWDAPIYIQGTSYVPLWLYLILAYSSPTFFLVSVCVTTLILVRVTTLIWGLA